MKKMPMRIAAATAALLALAVLVSGMAAAAGGPDKVDVCHCEEDGSYNLITISTNACDAHLAHGDGLPGQTVPGVPGKIFGADCSLHDAPLSGYAIASSSTLYYADGGWGGWSVPAGKVVTGGGFDADGPVAVSTAGTPGSVWPHYTYGPSEYGWVVRDAPGVGGGSTTTLYAVYADMPAGYGIVWSPAMAFGDGGYGGWSCPAGKVVLGGGFRATGPVVVSAPGTPDSEWPHYTYGPLEYGWVVRDAQDGASNTIEICAVCADPVAGYEVVNSAPLYYGDGGYGGWSVPAGKVVLSGGFQAAGPVAVSAPGTPDSVWPHYTFGSSEYGWVVRDAQDGASNTMTLYAVCANPF